MRNSKKKILDALRISENPKRWILKTTQAIACTIHLQNIEYDQELVGHEKNNLVLVRFI